MAKASLRIGIDTGGTFTDIVCVDTASGAVSVTKVPSTPANPALGLVDGVKKILRRGRLEPKTASSVSRMAPRSRPTRCCRARSIRSG